MNKLVKILGKYIEKQKGNIFFLMLFLVGRE